MIYIYMYKYKKIYLLIRIYIYTYICINMNIYTRVDGPYCSPVRMDIIHEKVVTRPRLWRHGLCAAFSWGQGLGAPEQDATGRELETLGRLAGWGPQDS